MAQPLASEIDRLVGQRIQRKRRELGFTAEKLSEYVNLTQPQLSRYERGTNKINVAHLVAIATSRPAVICPPVILTMSLPAPISILALVM